MLATNINAPASATRTQTLGRASARQQLTPQRCLSSTTRSPPSGNAERTTTYAAGRPTAPRGVDSWPVCTGVPSPCKVPLTQASRERCACGSRELCRSCSSSASRSPAAVATTTTPPSVGRAQVRGRRALRRPRVRGVRRVDHRRRGHARRDRSLPRPPDAGPAGGGSEGLDRRTRRLRRHRGVPLLRRADRRSEDRARRPDQRLADGRGLRRLRRGRRRRRHRQRPRRLPDDHRGRHRREQREGRRDEHLHRAGTRSSSCCGARTARRTVPARGRSSDYTTGAQRRPPGDVPAPATRSLLERPDAACRRRGRPTAAPTARSSSTTPTRR